MVKIMQVILYGDMVTYIVTFCDAIARKANFNYSDFFIIY